MNILIRNAVILRVDVPGSPSTHGDIHLRDGRFAEVGHFDRPGDVDHEIDATGMIAMPGLVDSHRHCWQHLLRSMSSDQTVVEYRAMMRAAYGSRYRPEDVYAATLLADLEALNCGVTAIADMAHIMNSPEHADAALAAHRESGIRVRFMHGVPNDASAAEWWSASARPHPHDIRRLREQLSDDEARVSLGMFARPPFLVTEDVLRHDMRLAGELGLHVTIDGGLGGGCWSSKRWGDEGMRPVAALAEIGELDEHVTLVHGNNLPDSEWRLLADSGAHLSISPEHEMLCGHGLPATKNALRHGIQPGLSIDSVIAVSSDMFGTMRAALTATRGAWADDAYARGTSVDTWQLTTADVLRFATQHSAQACGYGDSVGAIRPGARADLVLLRPDPLNLSLRGDPVSVVVTNAHPGNVDTVIVDGEVRKAGGVLAFPVERALGLAEAAREHVVATAPPSTVDAAWARFS